MSRRLPAHPNLEHLKKQAKDLLADLRRQNPAAKLADAQQAVAREYGFATWPQLKSHVELLLDPVDRPAARGVTDPCECLRRHVGGEPVEVDTSSRAESVSLRSGACRSTRTRMRRRCMRARPSGCGHWVKNGGIFEVAMNSGHMVHRDAAELVVAEIRRLVQIRR